MARGLRTLLTALAASVAFAAPASPADVVVYYHLDAIGNVRAVTNQAGQVIERHDYLPFGEECTTAPCTPLQTSNTRKFTGKERDAETGLDYFGARYYRGNVGRFTTVDPTMNIALGLLDPQRWNRYSYGLDNPFRNVDPDGRDAIWVKHPDGTATLVVPLKLSGEARPRAMQRRSQHKPMG